MTTRRRLSSDTRSTLAVLGVLALLATTASCESAPKPAAPPTPHHSSALGGLAPELRGEQVSGFGPTTLAAARGRVVIVDFWATFCEPCERSFPYYETLQERFGGSVAVIAVSLDSPMDVEAGALRSFAQRTGATFPILWDADGSLKQLYEPPSLPTSFIIDQSGHVAYVHAKYETGDIEIIEQEVEKLLVRVSPAGPRRRAQEGLE